MSSPETAVSVVNMVDQVTNSAPATPLFQGLAWFFGVLATVLALAKPLLGIVRQYKTDRTDNARDDADKATFDRQTTQITQLMENVKRIMDERDTWFKEAIELKSRLDHLDGYEETMLRMKDKLSEKDGIIQELRVSIRERDDRIIGLMDDLMKTNDRLHNLEIRLARDEQLNNIDRAGGL